MIRDEAFQEYEATLARIDKQARETREAARVKLQERLKALRDAAHEELKAIRAITQKTKRR